MKRAPSVAAGICMGLGITAHPAQAQAPPDAGTLRQQIEQQRVVPLPDRTQPLAPAPAPLRANPGTQVRATAFRFVGNTLLSDEQLAREVAGFVDRSLSFAELQDAAIAVAAAYRRAGWVVRAYLPQQDITSGTVAIQVVEARFGAVRVDGAATRISDARLTAIVLNAQAPGAPVNGDALDRALLLIGDLPGVGATGRLDEGGRQGETDLVLDVVDRALAHGELAADNAGLRATGEARVLASLSLDSPLAIGDQASLLVIHARGNDYYRAAYGLPVGPAGWRVGVDASRLAYKVIASGFAQLDARGTSTAYGATATYPLIRARTVNLYASLAASSKHFDNEALGATTTRYDTRAGSVGLYGNAFDDFGAGGSSAASVTVVQGRLNLDGSPNAAADAATTRSDGAYRVVRASAERQQRLSDTWSLFASIAGQAASRNLDTSEKFYLGGAAGVRAYPASEAGGTQAVLLTVEARARLPANVEATGFYDRGAVRVHRDEVAGTATPNRYHLQGAGASIGWVAPVGLAVKVTVARRIGGNPGATATGDDQDGTHRKYRFWLQASLPY